MLLRRQLLGSLRPFSIKAAEAKLSDFRTLETDPRKHATQHIGRFYRVPDNVKKQIFAQGGLPREFERQTKTFAETCIMVRPPAVEIISYIEQTVNPSLPTARCVLYGPNGVGKSLTMAHLLHYGFVSGFILVHVPYAPYWYKWPKEFAASATREGFTDLPLDAAAWLINFKAQNTQLLSNPDLTISKEYVWSKRETTPAGSSLQELIDHGINRVKFACDTIEVLIEELKLSSTSGKCKVMVAIDGYNIFWWPKTRLSGQYNIPIKTDAVSLTKPFKSITNYDWSNGVCILSVDTMAVPEQYHQSPLPKFLLGKEGFEHLDPFIPVEVKRYDEKEYTNCIDYYLDRRWIQNSQPGFDTELEFLSNRNPYDLMRLCAPL